jgi:uncharacterized membrane protein YgdD (TMEM256/DUF423 family)
MSMKKKTSMLVFFVGCCLDSGVLVLLTLTQAGMRGKKKSTGQHPSTPALED